MTEQTVAQKTMHTPGPWKAVMHGIDGPDGLPILDVTASYDITFPDDADLRLIAAAPDLLTSVREFVALYDGLRDAIGPSVSAKLARAEAAIAKAEGAQ